MTPSNSPDALREDEQLAEAFMHSYYGMYTAEALTSPKFADREMIVVDADLVAEGIAKLVSLCREQARQELLDELEEVARTITDEEDRFSVYDFIEARRKEV